MRKLSTFLIFVAVAGPVLAEGPTCSATAAEKKLAGAAKASFMKKCQADARAACTQQATDKKLAGAAKASFEKKCVKDSAGDAK